MVLWRHLIKDSRSGPLFALSVGLKAARTTRRRKRKVRCSGMCVSILGSSSVLGSGALSV